MTKKGDLKRGDLQNKLFTKKPCPATSSLCDGPKAGDGEEPPRPKPKGPQGQINVLDTREMVCAVALAIFF